MNELNSITMKLHVDPILMMALQEDISSEDVTTNAGGIPSSIMWKC